MLRTKFENDPVKITSMLFGVLVSGEEAILRKYPADEPVGQDTQPQINRIYPVGAPGCLNGSISIFDAFQRIDGPPVQEANIYLHAR